ncbi:hypothetical protein [Planomicrobium sp. CPCC 101079]|uniref:hypothetical protein n=1 Tax=Planomicrobium sp. CPCC 101079 TaxID=2599618 RepID=UPI0011B55C87|nr:hypothetical protein [Planomicrobium sp. CPCC 101079]TWT06178.1 hypothetical protein FQV28_07330 [Planomicrobium sp. CPCC 101079]
MIKQRIGNVGVLNLLNATEESVKSFGEISNVGMVLYKSGQSHLLASLTIGNIGKTVEVPDGYRYYNGKLTIDPVYVNSLNEPLKMVVSGMVILGKELKREQLEDSGMKLIVNGEIYAPTHLAGFASQFFAEGSHTIEFYTDAPPRFENGVFTLSNSFLNAAVAPLHLVVDGVLELPKSLDMELFQEKIEKITVNGVVTLHEEQESALYKKMESSLNGVINVIPAGYELIQKKIRLNSRSIRSFRGKKLLTKKPILLEADITREAFEGAFEKINSKSFIVCHEELEDLVYERLDRFETEVLSYTDHFVVIEGEQEWSEDQFQAFENPVNLLVEGILSLKANVTAETLQAKVAAIDLFGEIQVPEEKLKGAVQSKIRANEGHMITAGETAATQSTGLQNVGELSL